MHLYLIQHSWILNAAQYMKAVILVYFLRFVDVLTVERRLRFRGQGARGPPADGSAARRTQPLVVQEEIVPALLLFVVLGETR